jgi:hypothetical protein
MAESRESRPATPLDLQLADWIREAWMPLAFGCRPTSVDEQAAVFVTNLRHVAGALRPVGALDGSSGAEGGGGTGHVSP